MGSDIQTGEVTLKARASGQSRINLSLGGVPRSEIRINDPLNPLFETFAGGQWTTRAPHNSWVDANWFFPALSALVVGPQKGFALGSISDSSHLYSQFQITGQKAGVASQIQNLSSVLYKVDPSTLFPVALHFVFHPDSDFGVSIPVDVQFSDYRTVSGVQVPFRIEHTSTGPSNSTLRFPPSPSTPASRTAISQRIKRRQQMTTQRILALVGLVTMLIGTAYSQIATGTPPFSSTSGGSFDSIDLGNLNVHIEIPIISRAGRGIPLHYSWSYDRSIWYPSGGAWTPVSNWGWRSRDRGGGRLYCVPSVLYKVLR